MKNLIIKIVCLSVGICFGIFPVCQGKIYKLTTDGKLLFQYDNTIRVETYEWPQTLITYPVIFEGNIQQKDLVLYNKHTNQQEVFQLSNIHEQNGYLTYAEISFMAELPQKGNYKYELSIGKKDNKETKNIPVSSGNSRMEISGHSIQVQIPESTTINAHEAPAPVLALNQGNQWIGENKLISPVHQIIALRSETINQGPLFHEQQLTYTFRNGGEYVAKVKVVRDYPFIILDETMTGLYEKDGITLEMEWQDFHPVKRFGTQWDRTLEGDDAWLGINTPVYTSYSKEDPRWTGMGWIEKPADKMIFRISPFGGNSVREQTPVMSFWEETEKGRELSVFVFDHNRWNDKQYGIWQPTPLLSIYFRYKEDKLYFTYPLIDGTRSTAISFFDTQKGVEEVEAFDGKLAKLAERGGKHNPKNLFYRYSQLLLMQYATLSLDRIKEWELTYPAEKRRAENPFPERPGGSAQEFIRQMYSSPMAYYPMGLNYYPGIHSIEHRILYTNYVEDYLRYYTSLTPEQRQTVEGLFIMGGYVNMLEEMNAIRYSLAGTANMASDGWSVPPQISFLFPEHPMAKEWADFFEKSLEIYGLFYTRPEVNTWQSKAGRWVESMGIYNWAYLRPTSHSNIAGELYDGKNRFASSYMVQRAEWMRDMMTAPVNGKGRAYPPHGAHGSGYLVPLYSPLYQTAEWLRNYDPIIAEHIFYTGPTGEEVEKKKTDSDWHTAYEKVHPEKRTGTNPHLKSVKYTGHGIVLRAATDTPEELSIHLDQVDKGPNYRWGNQAEGNSGGLYFYAGGKVYTAHENELAGDHIVNNLDGITNFGVMKNGEFRTVGYNELKAPLYDFGFAQFAELLADDGKDNYVWPDYISRSVMLAGNDYFILFDEVGTNWRAAGRFSWFNKNGEEFPKIIFLSDPARKDNWMTAQTLNTNGFYRDNFGSVLTLVTHKKEEITVNGGKINPSIMVNDPHIGDFIRDKNSNLPKGVHNIKTPQSSDLIFRNDKVIQYDHEETTFYGKAGMIRRFEDGTLQLSVFKGKQITAEGLSIQMETEGTAAIALERTSNNEINGMIKTDAPVGIKLSGIPSGGKLYANGIAMKGIYNKETVEVTLPEGEYHLEYTKGKPYPMESIITGTEYDKDKVKVLIDTTSPCESVQMQISYDGGKNWKDHGKASKGIYFFPKEKVSKVHIRAVAMNGKKEAKTANEYPVYFTEVAPHYPEGLWLKLNDNEVSMSWGAILGTQSYRIYRRKAGDTNFNLIYEGKERTFTDKEAYGVRKAYCLPGNQDNIRNREEVTIYEYAVTAVNGNGESFMSPAENTDPASWRNWYPDTELKFKRQSAFWMAPYVYPEMEPEKYYPE